jgi:hypothetical protein
MKQILLTFLAMTLFVDGASAQWTVWTTGSGGNGHVYEAVWVADGIDWFSARGQAEARGGYLATITSAAENDVVFSLVALDSRFWFNMGADTRGPWLGGYQADGSSEPGGGWTWVSGEPFSYQNWAVGEPNNYDPTEGYLHFLGKGNDTFANTWNDLYPDGGPHGFIVEYVPEPGTGALAGLSIVVLILLRRKR